MKLKRGTCTTDPGFAGLLLSLLWQLFTLNTITDLFFSKNLTSQYFINYSSSLVLMYFYKLEDFMSNFDLMFYGFDFKDLQTVHVESRSMRHDSRTHSFVKVSDGQYRNTR